ncbi:MAG: geranylgeranyl diphosphate synthase, type II [archaeon GW2011_AR18]|nr:MAG: geranylgeranyl diphosphate synthase, type II [archaeon GW2011_AR18]
MTDFKKFLADNKPIIWEEIKKYLPDDGPHNFAEVISEYPRRQGKYGRGGLILLSYGAFGDDCLKAVKTAAAMQLSEDWLLIHDDIMDDSEERRGNPALHRLFGDELAINAGDYLNLLMWKVLIDNKKILGNELSGRVMSEFIRFLDITLRGQHTESFVIKNVGLNELSDKVFEDIAYGKSAEYTIAGPMRLGAIIAGESDETLLHLTEVGIPLGIGFQIRDDLLNISGNGAVYGKEIGGDIYEGKRTLLLIHLINNTIGEEHDRIVDIMKKSRKEKTVDEVRYVIGLMKEKGSIGYAENRAQVYADEARNKFNRYFPNIKDKDIFEAAIDFFTMKRDL